MQAIARRGLVEIEERPAPEVFRFMAKCPGFKKWTDKGGCVFEASRVHVELWQAAVHQ